MQYTPLNSGNENKSLLIIDEDEVSNFRYDEVPEEGAGRQVPARCHHGEGPTMVLTIVPQKQAEIW